MAENIAWFRAEAADFAERAGLEPALVADVRLAVSEAVTNVVQHAYGGDARGLVVVEAGVEPDAIVVAVEDGGFGRRPFVDLDSDLPRLGLAMIASRCAMELRRRQGGGMKIVMRFTTTQA